MANNKNSTTNIIENTSKKIETSLDEIEQFFLENKDADVFRNFSPTEKKDFEEKMLNNEDIYYDCYDYKAADFRKKFLPVLDKFDPQILNNIGKFRNVVNSIYKRKKLTIALDEMECNSKGFDKVIYTPKNNRDSLHRMQISHDTLLEYGKAVFESRGLLRKFFIDMYPIVLVDEYQDTDAKVVELLKIISNYAQKKELRFVVGYFGDTVQNIYETGVGERWYDIEPTLKKVNKKFNRRSTIEIITVINAIRNDQICQESIYKDDAGGSVEVIEVMSKDDLFDLVNANYKKHHQSGKKDFAALFLKNEDIANLKEFPKLYTCLANMPRYSGGNYLQLTTETLSSNAENLGYFQRTLRNLIEFTELVEQDETPLNQVKSYLKDEDRELSYQYFNFNNLYELRKIIKDNSGKTLESYIDYLIHCMDKNILLKMALKNIFQMEDVSLKMIKRNAHDFFYRTKSDPDEADDYLDASHISDLFKVHSMELRNWYHYLIGELSDSINYMTFHGSKGLEFDHVLLVLGNSFSRRKNFFSVYFENLSGENLVDKKKEYWKQARNLFYVACSRAKINLTIVILGEEINSSESKLGIEKIAGSRIIPLSEIELS